METGVTVAISLSCERLRFERDHAVPFFAEHGVHLARAFRGENGRSIAPVTKGERNVG